MVIGIRTSNRCIYSLVLEHNEVLDEQVISRLRDFLAVIGRKQLFRLISACEAAKH